MRSELMAEGLPGRVLEAIAALESAPLRALTDAASVFAKVAVTGKYPAPSDLLPVAQSHDVSLTEINKWFTAAFGILHFVQEHGDNSEDILVDLVEKKAVKSGDEMKLRLDVFGPEIQAKYHALAQSRRALSASFPVLSEFAAHSVDTFVTAPHVPWAESIPDRYEPAVQTVVPTIVIRLEIEDNDETKTVRFAITPEQAGDIVARLKMAKTELAAVSSHRPQRK